jgi:hypothetical protein
VPPMRGCDAACPQAPASAAAVWAGRPLMRRLRIRRNRRTRARSPTTEVASTDGRHTIFPVSCRHSRTPIIRHGRPAKDKADLSSLRSAHEARQATALARPQTPRGPPVSVHRLRACRHGRVAPSRRERIIEAGRWAGIWADIASRQFPDAISGSRPTPYDAALFAFGAAKVQ